MFQRLTNLLFGRVNETTEEPTVPKPGSPDMDVEGWLLVSAAGEYSITNIKTLYRLTCEIISIQIW